MLDYFKELNLKCEWFVPKSDSDRVPLAAEPRSTKS